MSFFSGPRHGGARGSCGAPQKFGPLSPGRSRSLPRADSLGGQRKTPVARILGLAWLRLTKILRVNFLVELAEERVLKLKFYKSPKKTMLTKLPPTTTDLNIEHCWNPQEQMSEQPPQNCTVFSTISMI